MKFKADKELKQIIKHLVKETLMEVLAESKIQSIVEESITKSAKYVPESFKGISDISSISSVSKVTLEKEQKSKILLEKRRNRIVNDLKVPEDVWASIYEDTAKSNNSVLTDDSPELVSEGALEAMGLMEQDFSKHIGVSAPKNQEEDDEYAKLMLERTKMLKKNSRGL